MSLNNFTNFVCFNREKQDDILLISPENFEMMIIPFENSNNLNAILTPKEYLELIKKREGFFIKMKNKIKDSNLTEEQEKALHIAIQGHFREWLVSAGNFKNMVDIVKNIDIGYNTKDQNINEI
jgi:hypothetical protein